MPQTRRFGLIGKSLRHSLSADYFGQKFLLEGLSDCRFDLFPVDLSPHNVAASLSRLILDHHLLGFSVTIPYKQLVMPLLASISDEALSIGAVNSIRVDWAHPDPHRSFPFSLHGFNTDAPGFAHTLRPLLQPWHTEALILGTGGASLAVHYALRKMGITPHYVSRRPDGNSISYPDAYQRANDVFLIINATPVGTFPDDANTPWSDLSNISPRHLCYDLVYNPPTTRFLADCKASGATVQNGLPMLHRQADLSWEIWNR